MWPAHASITLAESHTACGGIDALVDRTRDSVAGHAIARGAVASTPPMCIPPLHCLGPPLPPSCIFVCMYACPYISVCVCVRARPQAALQEHLADPMGTTIFSKAAVIPGQAIAPPCKIAPSVQFQGERASKGGREGGRVGPDQPVPAALAGRGQQKTRCVSGPVVRGAPGTICVQRGAERTAVCSVG